MKIGKLIVSSVIVIAGLNCSESINPIGTENSSSVVSCARSRGAGIISTNRLSSELAFGTTLVIDVRSAEEYADGHIPNSINIPFDIISVWAQTDFSPNGLWLELPEFSDLITSLGTNGISKRSKVVLVTGLPTEANPYSLAAPTRVAMTLAYAGLQRVSILDGGFDKWAAEGKPVSTEETIASPVEYHCRHEVNMIVEREYVESKLGKVILIDARDAVVYSGEVVEPFADKAGHIPTAVSLPAPSLWNEDGTYKSKNEIRAIARSVVGRRMNKEIVIYCGVGGYASTVWYALTKILNYSNVKVYDGSAQEWVQTNDMEM